MTTLVMFSGGLDSTAMLVKLLAESADDLRVHHIRMVNREGRDRAEQRAVEAIVAYCRARYRAFRYSESALDFSALEAIPIDYLSIAFVACQVAIDTPGCDRVAIGALATRHRHREPLGAPEARFRRDVRVLPRAQARRAAGRVDLPGLRHPQGRACGGAAAGAPGPDMVLSSPAWRAFAPAGLARLASPGRACAGTTAPAQNRVL